MLYAVVDIETTGSYAAGNGITEIALVVHDGKKVLDFYETLVNPQIGIPRFIQSLTGITNEMVAHAPRFEEIAERVSLMLQDKIFVAHNVNFDYSFLKYHLGSAGFALGEKKLCTVRLARKIIPGLTGYSLNKLCNQLNVNLTNHHRAGGDALATAEIFKILVERDKNNVILNALKGRNKEQYLPPHLPGEHIDKLPGAPGVYYFYNSKGKIIYVGKAVNLSKRVKSHFANNKAGKQKQDFLREIHRVSYRECATELMAHILESTEIRRLWPIYNRSQRGYLPKYGLFVYEDRQGFKRFAIEKNKQYYKPVYTFNTLHEGNNLLRQLIREYGLCVKLCNIAKDCDCSNHDKSAFYNAKMDRAIAHLQEKLPSFALIDRGIQDDERSCILVKEGNFYGMGYIKWDQPLNDMKILQQDLEPLQDNDYIRNIVYKHAATHPEKCVQF